MKADLCDRCGKASRRRRRGQLMSLGRDSGVLLLKTSVLIEGNVICFIWECWFTTTCSLLPDKKTRPHPPLCRLPPPGPQMMFSSLIAGMALPPAPVNTAGHQMESGSAHCISGQNSVGRLGSIPSHWDCLELIAERYGSYPTICQLGW